MTRLRKMMLEELQHRNYSAVTVVGDSRTCNVGSPPFLWECGVIYSLQDLVLPGSDLTPVDVDTINESKRDRLHRRPVQRQPPACW